MLVAIALLSVLLGGVFAFWLNLTSSRERIRTWVEREQATRVFLDRLETYLACTMVRDPEHGSGVVGGPHAVRLLTRGVAVDRTPSGTPSALGDLQTVEFRFDRLQNQLRARSGPAGSPGRWVTIADELGLVRFRYLDRDTWVARYNAGRSDRLPVAIEVAVWYRPIEPDDAEMLASPGPDGGSGAGAGMGGAAGERSLRGEGLGLGGEADAAAGTDPLASLTDGAAAMDAGPIAEPVPVEDYERYEPDRLLTIVVPDAPQFEYSRSYDDNPAAADDLDFPAGGMPMGN